MKKQLTVILFLVSATLFAQKTKVVKGDFDFINGQKEINVEFVYDNMKLLKKDLSNEEYMEEHAADLDKKGRGRGDTWKKKWISSREDIYKPKFLELMNRNLYEDHGLDFGDFPDAQYTLIVETVWVFPGWNAAVMRQPAKVSTNLKFVETSNRDKIMLEVTAKHAPGNRFGGTFSNEDRIGEGYAKTGKTLAKMIDKKAF